MKQLTKLSLFSGILGDDLASEWAGVKTICCVEIDPFCQKVIKKHYPNMPIIGDIHDVTKEKLKEVSGYEWVDIISGGDPCQPRSVAGKRRGKEDDRDLWEDMFRVIQEFRPTWVINENPTGRLTMDFHEVLSNLESIGYGTRSFVIPACAVNACHKRDRLFIVAYSQKFRDSQFSITRSDNEHIKSQGELRGSISGENLNPNSNNNPTTRQRENSGVLLFIPESDRYNYNGWERSWVESATSLCRMDDGFPNRVARLKALGNAVVPQQIYPIYKVIVEIENSL